MKQIHIIGAGFSGMSLAYYLTRSGAQVTIYEKRNRVGGLIQTLQLPEGLVETAANSFIRTERTDELFQTLGIESLTPKATAKKRFIFNAKPRRWPLSFSESLTHPPKAIFNILVRKKKSAPLEGETVLSWGQRVLGKSLAEKILSPALQGIYAADASQLSAKLILGPLFQKKEKGKKRYKGILTAPQGMGQVMEALKNHLLAQGVKFKTDTDVDVSSLPGNVIVCTSAQEAASLLQDVTPELGKALSEVPMTSLMTCTLFFKADSKKYHGFGCLVPQSYGTATLGILFNSDIFPHRDRIANETWILGGKRVEEFIPKSDEEVLAQIAQERFQLLKVKDGLLNYSLTRWKNALPLYNLHLEKIWQEGLLHKPHGSIRVHGNYLYGIGLSKILEGSYQMAEQIQHE